MSGYARNDLKNQGHGALFKIGIYRKRSNTHSSMSVLCSQIKWSFPEAISETAISMPR